MANYLNDIEFIKSPNHSSRGGIVPRMVVLHYTADTGMRAVNFFQLSSLETERPASAHYVVQRDGQIYQMVELGRAAWHAGFPGSDAHLRERLRLIQPNESSVGIEIVNAGELNNDGRTYYGEQIPDDEIFDYYGNLWQTFAEPQIIAVAQLVTHLCNELDIPLRFMFEGGLTTEDEVSRSMYGKPVPYYLPSGNRLAARRWLNNAGICGHCHISKAKDDPGPAIVLWRSILGI